jgi:hypothetical protein
LDKLLQWAPSLIQIGSTLLIVFAAGRYIEKLNQTLLFNQKVLNNIEVDLKDHIEKDDERHEQVLRLIFQRPRREDE